MGSNKNIDIERGSGNVFADIGVPDAEEHLTKAKLVMRIRSIVKSRKLTQQAAGTIIGLKQPDVSKLLRGEFRGYSIERILSFLRALDQDVEIIVKPKGRVKRSARMTVRVA